MIGRGQRRLDPVRAPGAAEATTPRLPGTRAHLRRFTRAHEQPAPEADTIGARIEAARGGDRQALETVIRHYQDRLARFIISIVGREAEYEDFVPDRVREDGAGVAQTQIDRDL